MRIKMLETRRGTEDGIAVREYRRGEEYELGDMLARAFLAAGFAVRIFPPRPPRKKPALRGAFRLRLVKQ